MKKYLVLLILGWFSLGTTSAQVVKVIDFAQFEDMLQRDNDTLYVYNFWASWCKPCIAELPYFERLNEEYAGRRLRVIFVSLDFPDQLPLVKMMASKKSLTAELLLLDEADANSWIPKVSDAWSGALPATLLRMRSRDIHLLRQESFTYESLTEWIDDVLNKV
jgi:thiol-disulfide isomerase/thioredoxin